MAPVKPGSYLFRKESIAELRQRLGLSQAAMAERLGVPKNTVSRWETGATTPDGDSLAAIYSLGMEVGVVAQFFTPTTQKASVRDAALVYWYVDLSQWPMSPWLLSPSLGLERLDTLIRDEVRKRVPHASRELFKAFLSSPSSPVATQIKNLGWRVWEPEIWGFQGWSEEIYDQALSDAGQDPFASVVFLVATDVKHVETITELQERHVRVYLVTPRMSVVSSPLIEAVGKQRWIELA